MTLLSRFAAAAFAVLLGAGLAQPSLAAMGDRPGDFDYYALVLSWSPSFCLSGNGSHEGDPQCGTTRPYAFVLHGLWPQFDKGWPESCDTGGDATLPPDLARSMLDIMPSEKLVSHEYEKHGTCSGLDARGYFGLARQIYASIVIPPKYVNLSAPLQVPLAQLRSDLLTANPRLGPDMIAVDCDKNGRLVEVHFCFTKQGQPKACGRNEIQAKMCRQDLLSMPPVRGRLAGVSGDAGATAGAAATAGQAVPDNSAASDNAGAANDNGAANGNGNDGYTSHRHRHHHHFSFFSY